MAKYNFPQNQERVVIENISPSIEGGIYAIKTIANQEIRIEADILADGHDVLRAVVKFKNISDKKWQEVDLSPTENDRWAVNINFSELGIHNYSLEAWVDWPLNWLFGTRKKIHAAQDVKSELLEGAEYLRAIVDNLDAKSKKEITAWIGIFNNSKKQDDAKALVLGSELEKIFWENPTRHLSAKSQEFTCKVERDKALFSTWYEFFPRSASSKEGKHGTFKDCEKILPRVANMGFDVLYFPPVHPIGEVNRKGKNNATDAQKGDVGSPWGIGSKHGGHMSLHPELGNEKDFKSLVEKAKSLGIEIAMDYALQAAPDHPWVKENPQWFKWRPDGTAQYAENPPKKYQDILPIYFETPDWKNLWAELLKVALYWVEEFGISIFRVDNPHTKPFHFWAWLIEEVQAKHPHVIFLAEAFTRPKIMEQLAKQGFTQGYSYFTWRTNKDEIIQYVNELTQTDRKYYFRPNFWPNTPDINPFHLQSGNESIHLHRYVLAATLSSNTGVYGPVYEQLVGDALPGREEYMDSEKYEFRHWDWKKETTLTQIITLVNKARKNLKSLQQTNNIAFLEIDNPNLIAFHKWDFEKKDRSIVVVSLDPHYPQKGWVKLPLAEWGISEGHQIRVQDQVTEDSYNWDKEWSYVELHPVLPFHIFKVEF
jgi:starch synthase (maltosyl-transferring)